MVTVSISGPLLEIVVDCSPVVYWQCGSLLPQGRVRVTGELLVYGGAQAREVSSTVGAQGAS